MTESLIPEALINSCAIRSGGLMTDFLRMIKDSSLRALAQRRESLNERLLNASFHQLVLDFNANIDSKYYPKLIEVYKDKYAKDDPDKIELLYRLAILEYTKDEGLPWHDTHPAIEVLLREKKLILPENVPNQE